MEVEVVSRFVAIGDGDGDDLELLVHERKAVDGPARAGESCPPAVLLAPGAEGGLGPGIGAGAARQWGAECAPAQLGQSVYARLGQALAADHGMLCAQLRWRAPADGSRLEAAATDLLLAMRWAQQRQAEWSAEPGADPPDVWLVGFGFGGAALLTATDFLSALDEGSRPRIGAVALLATALAGPATGGELVEQRDLPRALHGIGAPVLLLQGAADGTVPARAALDAFACAAEPKRLVLIHDGDHRFTSQTADVVDYLRGWARERLLGSEPPLLPSGMQGFDCDEELQQTVRRARSGGAERRAAAAAAAAAESAKTTESVEMFAEKAQARLAVTMGASDAEMQGRLAALKASESSHREQIEHMRAQVEMLKLRKLEVEKGTAMLAARAEAAAEGASEPEEAGPVAEAEEGEAAGWDAYGDALESGLAELKALRAQLRS